MSGVFSNVLMNLTLWSAQYWPFRRILALTLGSEIFPALVLPSFSLHCLCLWSESTSLCEVPSTLKWDKEVTLVRVPLPQRQQPQPNAFRWCCLQMKARRRVWADFPEVAVPLPQLDPWLGLYLNSPLIFPVKIPCCPRDSQESSPTPQFKSINSSALSFLYSLTLTSTHDHWKNQSFDYMDLCWQSNVSAF